MTPLRVVLVANTTWNLAHFRGGLIAALLAQGSEVHVLAPPDAATATLTALGVQCHPIAVDSQGTHPRRDAALCWALWRAYRRIKPDVVLHYTIKPVIYGALAARLAGVPSLATITGLGTAFLRDGWLNRLAKGLYRVALAPAPVVMFQNPDDSRLFVEQGLVRAAQVREVAGSGVDIARFTPSPLPSDEGRRVVLFVGRLLRDKGVLELVDAARQLRSQWPKVQVCLLGGVGVANRSALGAADVAAWQAEGVIEYWGETDDVRPALAQAECVVLPSYREGTPRTLLEAAAMGRPLIATDVPGCREVVQHGKNGLLCQSHSADALAAALSAFLALPRATREQMGEAARLGVVQRFNQQNVVQTYMDVISHMVELPRDG